MSLRKASPDGRQGHHELVRDPVRAVSSDTFVKSARQGPPSGGTIPLGGGWLPGNPRSSMRPGAGRPHPNPPHGMVRLAAC